MIDTGIGIIPEMQRKIFAPYFRTARGENENSGDGIGLSFVKELVELHHGEISMHSAEGKGSTFTVSFPKGALIPASNVPADNPTSALAITESSGNQGVEVNNPTSVNYLLVLDDNPETVNILSQAFSNEFHVMKATDPETAMDLIGKTRPDVIITELNIPGIDGHSFIRSVRSNKKLSGVRIIVFTALNSEEDMLTAYDEGADAYYIKPMSMQLLRRQVDILLSQKGNDSEIFHHIAQTSAQDNGSPDSEDSLESTASNAKTRYNREEQEFLRECRRVIDDNLANPDFSIEVFAAKMSMSHSSLYKKIKSLTGMSVVGLINEYRVYRAIQYFRKATPLCRA